MKQRIINLIKESIALKYLLLKTSTNDIASVAKLMLYTIKSGKKILIFGNGGSAADSLHMEAELIGRFRKERHAFPAIALSSNPSVITALGNDYKFEYIFERQIEALGRKGDLALGISTSGKSKNVLRAILKAKKLQLKTVVLAGKDKTKLSEVADISINVPSRNTPRVQEAHITILHVLCDIIENGLAKGKISS